MSCWALVHAKESSLEEENKFEAHGSVDLAVPTPSRLVQPLCRRVVFFVLQK